MAELTLHLPSQARPSRRPLELLTLLLIGLAIAQLALLWGGPHYLSPASVPAGLPQHIAVGTGALILLAAASAAQAQALRLPDVAAVVLATAPIEIKLARVLEALVQDEPPPRAPGGRPGHAAGRARAAADRRAWQTRR